MEMTSLPIRIELPEMPSEHVVTGEEPLRYDDITQDGRLRLLSMPHALGTLWRELMSTGPLRDLARQGTLAILTHLHVRGGDGPIAVSHPLQVRACHRLAHTQSEDGNVERILLDMWAELEAPLGRTHGPQPEGAGNMIRAGSLFARHVLSRPFAPPGQRKVRRLEHAELPSVPERLEHWSPPGEIATTPRDVQRIDGSSGERITPVAFGLDHTDSNQHVNSLVYPRMFDDAARAQLAELGADPTPMMRTLHVGFRKPCFAGQRFELRLRAFAPEAPEASHRAFVDGAFAPCGHPAPEEAHTYLRALFFDEPAV